MIGTVLGFGNTMRNPTCKEIRTEFRSRVKLCSHPMEMRDEDVEVKEMSQEEERRLERSIKDLGLNLEDTQNKETRSP